MSDSTEQFVRQLTEHQNRMYGYVFSLLGDHSRAADVVQETNMVLWRKIAEFEPDRPFLPWAFGIARMQVLASLRDQKRDRFLLDPNLAEQMSETAEKHAGEFDNVREALRPCLQRLSEKNRDLIERRYYRGMTIDALATSLDRTAGSLKVALLRIRRQLGECVQKRLASETS